MFFAKINLGFFVFANLFLGSSSLLGTDLKKQRVSKNDSEIQLKSIQSNLIDQKNIVAPNLSHEKESQEKIFEKDKSLENKKIIDKKSQATIGLDFEKMQLSTFVDFIMGLKEMSYIPSQDLSNIETSLSVPQKITIDQAYELFLKVLEKEGYSLVQVGDLCKIVKRDAKYIEPLEPFLGKPSSDLPDSDKTVRYLTFLKNMSVSEAEPILKALLTPGAQLITLVNFNGILITDRCLSIKYAMKVINELDNAGFHEIVSMVRLKERNVLEIKDFLELIMNKKGGNDTSALARLLNGNVESSIEYFPSNVKIIAEERTNTLILMGTESALARVEDFVVNFLDKSLLKPETPFHIYECQHMDADNLKTILKDVTKSNDSSAAKFGGVRSGMRFFNQVKIESDKFGNKLIISCTDKQDWDIIHKLLIDLDKRQPQVFIDTLIVEISSQENKGMSGQLRNRSSGSPIPGVNFQTSGVTGVPYLTEQGASFVSVLSNMINRVGSLEQGTTFLSFGPADDIWAILKALNTQTKVSIISRPSITIANRATGNVGTKSIKRIVSEVVVSDTGTPSTLQGLQSAPAETKITYVPQINQEGLINLKVNISMSDFLNNEGNTIDKNLDTNITLANGQVVVMGGFVKTKAIENISKSPFSGIPILGMFLKSKGRNLDKSYIFFFVTATIFKPRETPGIGLYSKMRLQQSKQLVGDCVDTSFGKDPIQNYYFNGERENYDHKIVDFANARYQPTTVDIKRDPFYKNIFALSNTENVVGDKVESIGSIKTDSKKIIEKAVQKVFSSEIDQQVVRLPLDHNLEHDSKKTEAIKAFFKINKINKSGLNSDLKIDKNSKTSDQLINADSIIFNEAKSQEKDLYDIFKTQAQIKTLPKSKNITKENLRNKFLNEMGISEEKEVQANNETLNNSFAQYLNTGSVNKKNSRINNNRSRENFLQEFNGQELLEKSKEQSSPNLVQNSKSPTFLNYLERSESDKQRTTKQTSDQIALLDQSLKTKMAGSIAQKENMLRYLFQDAAGGDN